MVRKSFYLSQTKSIFSALHKIWERSSWQNLVKSSNDFMQCTVITSALSSLSLNTEGVLNLSTQSKRINKNLFLKIFSFGLFYSKGK